jgi:serine/threonine protein kinase
VLAEETAMLHEPPATSLKEKRSSALSGSLRSHSPTIVELQVTKSLNEFEVVDILGQGMVGLVLRAKHKGSGKVCAIKTMPKSQVIENGEEEHCMAERRALEELRHAPFVCNYYASFQDPWALYLVVEDCVGDMFDLFNRSGLPGIGQIKVYTAQVLLGLEYIHSAGYVYRDMKPENLLLRSDGSITIGDFGFAKKLEKGQRAYTICGTPDYLAPELILHQGCTRAADIWAFGILVFEMIAGFPPFRDRQRRDLYKRIVRADFAAVPVPRRMDNDVHEMLSQIFVRDESLRLGIRAPGLGAIKGHAWYETIDWEAVMSGKLRPLHFLPEQLSRADLSSIKDAKTGKFTWMNGPPPNSSEEKFVGF